MMGWSIFGVILVFVGTAFSLWTIITKDTKKAGTWGALVGASKDAKDEKRNVIIGIVLIFLGSALQVIGICQS